MGQLMFCENPRLQSMLSVPMYAHFVVELLMDPLISIAQYFGHSGNIPRELSEDGIGRKMGGGEKMIRCLSKLSRTLVLYALLWASVLV